MRPLVPKGFLSVRQTEICIHLQSHTTSFYTLHLIHPVKPFFDIWYTRPDDTVKNKHILDHMIGHFL